MTGAATRTSLLDIDFATLTAVLTDLGAPSYRARQIWQAVYRGFALDYEALTALPAALRTTLAGAVPPVAAGVVDERSSEDGSTTKALLRMEDGELIETVLMRYDPLGRRRGRRTVCVSTQAGCAMGCRFCATGAQGFRRQLGVAEVLVQVLTMARRASGEGAPLTNVVFMGMGEPLANYEVTRTVLDRLTDPQGMGMSPRRITVSSVGIVAGMQRLARDHPQVNLAVSLHAPDTALRRALVPVPGAGVDEIVAAARAHVQATGRRVSFEYVLVAGVNDSVAQARSLAALLRGLNCHVNLIPLNPSAGVFGRRPSRAAVLAFQRALDAAGAPATVRVEKGRDIAAACGQLRGDRVAGAPGARAQGGERPER